ncbi:YihY/virulence factor BrkB family protein [Homoserinimonas sp. OAct 916]|uniref:YihY/virulence factor BrkB family protein n=1 Tax=Homoserinimonas sp. OAct 916 TaxID=2211450 RepID=UPI0013003328|nr:YihY/virulence factor BrkB family protein [Homoserinimonas sp. OAct 916]
MASHDSPLSRMSARLQPLIAWAKTTRIARMIARFNESRGNLLASGLAFSAIFASFAGVFLLFAIAGFVLEKQPEIRDQLVSMVARAIPGLIDTGEGGAIDLDTLFASQILGWAGFIAAGVLLWTALGWMNSVRQAIRIIFELPPLVMNFFLLKVRDLGLIIALGVVVFLSATISVIGTKLLTTVFGWIGITSDSILLNISVRIVAFAVALVVDTVTLGAMFRVLAGIAIPWRLLLGGSLLGGVALGVLKVLGTLVIGGAGNNPLLAGFVVIISLMLWFVLVFRVILMAASFVAVEMDDSDARGTSSGRPPKVVAETPAETDHAAL